MLKDPSNERLREAIRRSANMTWEEFIAPLVAKGICDAEGNVLVSMPPPPRTVYDEHGNATIILPDLSQPPPPPERRTKSQAKAKPRPRAKADARKKPKPKSA